MADLIFVFIIVAFFGLAVGFVRVCDRIIGPDEAVGSPAAVTEPERTAA